MPYQIQIRKSAQKQLDKLPDDIADILLDAIETLAENPKPQGYKKLKGRKLIQLKYSTNKSISIPTLDF